MSDFCVDEEWRERTVVLAPSGELDLLTASLLSDAIHGASERRPSAMVVDLTKVTFLASSGMNALVAAHRLITRTGRFGVVADGRVTTRPLELSGVDRMVTVFRSLDQALAVVADA